jgi:hypothetical protein
MFLSAKHILIAIVITGFAFIGLTTFAPSKDHKVFGVYFNPNLSQNQILELLSHTSLTYAGFGDEDNIIVLSGDQSELDIPTVSEEIWFTFNPNGFAACGSTLKKLAFTNRT